MEKVKNILVNILVIILLFGLAALLGYYVVNAVVDRLPEQEETPVVDEVQYEEIGLNYNGPSDPSYGETLTYHDGITWREFLSLNNLTTDVIENGFEFDENGNLTQPHYNVSFYYGSGERVKADDVVVIEGFNGICNVTQAITTEHN